VPFNFSTRSLVGTSQDELEIQPHMPGLVRQVAERCVFSRGPIDFSPNPWLIEADAERLAAHAARPAFGNPNL
jgi:hypothetical protein